MFFKPNKESLMDSYKSISNYGSKPRYPQNKFANRYKERDEVAQRANPKDDNFMQEFMEDWGKATTLHQGQQQVIDAFFVQGCNQIFERIGRKGGKTTTNIMIAWRFAMERPKSMTYICLPTKALGEEIYWDEKRLHTCDSGEEWMQQKYIKNVQESDMMITFVNGSMIRIIGTWSESRGRGTQPDLLIVDECQDCKSEYLDAMEPNLAAKEDSRLVMTGTPPKKKNHYHEWEERIRNNTEKGKCFHFTSYINTALPHLKDWLDKKREELFAAGKEDVWYREYMAEDCFRSDDRLIPDIQCVDLAHLMGTLHLYDKSRLIPTLGVLVQKNRVLAIWGFTDFRQEYGFRLYALKSKKFDKLWDLGYSGLVKELEQTCEEIGRHFKRPWRKVVYDETQSFTDVVQGFSSCRKDIKWQDRGIALLREMVKTQAVHVTNEVGDLSMEAQSYLKDDDVREFPYICAISMMINETFMSAAKTKEQQEHWDRYEGLREMGLPTPPMKQNGKTLMSWP